MTTPIYKGRGQPVGSGGLFGDLGARLFGVTTPSYAGPGQPNGGSSGYLGGSGPAYKPAPKPTSTSAATKTTSDGSASTTATSGAPDDAASDAMPPYADPCGFPPGPIAIVIPRDLRGLTE